MIEYTDPFSQRKVKEGKWFAWFPVEIQGENRTVWLGYVNREWIEAAGYGMWVYHRIKV